MTSEQKSQDRPSTSRNAIRHHGKQLFGGARTFGSGVGRRLGSTGWKTRTALALGTVALLGAASVSVAVASLDDLDALEARRERPLRLEDATGGPLFARGERPADYATIERIPDALENAVIAIEDQRFRDHGGLDYRSIGRAFWTNAAAGEIVQGGSTISQQLVKISYLEPERTYKRKLHEALLTRELESAHTKDEILEMYLNRVYLGSGAYGMPSAAQVYFGKPIDDLSLAESALLAASIQAPSIVNPRNDMEAARDRAQVVIRAMVASGSIDENAANAALAELTVMAPSSGEQPYGGWFADIAARQGEQLAARFSGAGALRTTLDPELQRLAERAVQTRLAGLPMEAALVALRPDGSVAALVGGKDYQVSQFNRATQAQRQPGSTFKTFVYLTALADGYSPGTVISDRPVDIDGYAPENFGGRFYGDVQMATAFAKSMNAATVRLAMDTGLGNVVKTARLLGIDAELSETPSVALGASGVSLLDLTAAYGAIATGRAPFETHFVSGITAGNEQTYYPFKWKTPQMTGRTAQLMNARADMAAMLRAVVTDGTGKAVADVPGAVGKTGTSQNFRDALFVGWNDALIVGVWVGNDDNSPMDEVTGGSIPAEIWSDFLTAAQGMDVSIPQVAEPRAVEPEAVAPGTPDPAASGAQAVVAAVRSEPGEAEAVARDDRSELEIALGAALSRMENDGRVRGKDIEELRRTVERELQDGDVHGLREFVIRSWADSVGQTTAQQQCNIRACQRAYRSFRASDCTFQPYGGGPREICTQ